MNINLPKKISAGWILRILLILLILAEFYLGFNNLYKNLDPQPQTVASNNIIRVNRETFKQVSGFLDGLDKFVPTPPTLTNPSPFNLNQ